MTTPQAVVTLINLKTDELLSVSEAAGRLRLSVWTIRAWLAQGRIRGLKVGGRRLVALSELSRFVSEQNPPAPGPMAQAEKLACGAAR